jgi:hypothetical protein
MSKFGWGTSRDLDKVNDGSTHAELMLFLYGEDEGTDPGEEYPPNIVPRDKSILVVWQTGGTVVQYKIEHRPVGSTEWVTAMVPASAGQYTITVLDAATNYEVRVTPIDAQGNGTPGDIETVPIPETEDPFEEYKVAHEGVPVAHQGTAITNGASND